MTPIDAYDIVAFIVFAALFAAVIAVVVVLGGLPGRIAAKRGHPQAKAVLNTRRIDKNVTDSRPSAHN